ncbi:MAG: hypothetical protein SFT93_03745 [Rickettsiaceae bacterium]|nr:hypothetical protein [Rickettsiaceae bacterium]
MQKEQIKSDIGGSLEFRVICGRAMSLYALEYAKIYFSYLDFTWEYD